MILEKWLDKIAREQPETLGTTVGRRASAAVVNRAGSGRDARIRLFVAGLRYERKQGGDVASRQPGRRLEVHGQP